ncbi:MAG: GIY-YIG nuclease family protein [Eudoraea sp.]|nr:GIY-YIG nuclease family protein [Eudoraea sp.]
MPYSTYVLYSRIIKKFYVGYTGNLPKRMEQYNMGQAGFTSVGAPWKVIWFKEFNSKLEAINLEQKLKNLTRRRKVKFMLKYQKYLYNEAALNILNGMS